VTAAGWWATGSTPNVVSLPASCFRAQAVEIPEPGSDTLFGVRLLGLLGYRWRR
jgi:hypothetical protein